MNISAVVLTKNNENTIKKTLESLKFFDDVVVYDNGSSDKTISIAKSFNNVTLIEGTFNGFGPTRNQAIAYSSNNWILSLDADEVLSTELIESLKSVELNDGFIYKILRTNYYKQTKIKHCWGDDIIVRLFNKEKTSFCDNYVHEFVKNDGFEEIILNGPVEHYPYFNMTDFIIKLDRYSTLFAEENVGKKSSSPLKAILNAKFSFFKTYFLKRGFLDGYAGLVISFSHMATNFYKYMKLYELNKELKAK
jgi:glycosyltransferase involved in cell wall biosynthesis